MKKILGNILTFLGIKKILKTKLNFFEFKFFQMYNNFFNKTVIKQNKDFKSIPIIIISFNQLFYLKKLIDFLKLNNYNNIIIIDNNSTYEPLLQYFDEIESQITIHRLNRNFGHLVFWKEKELFNLYSKGYYVVTDADVNPVSECPEDFLQYFKKILDENFKITKVGFSLKIDDIPDTNLNKEKVLRWESRFWENKTKDNNYLAKIDTTFALYRPLYKYVYGSFSYAIRSKFPIQAIHGGWYIDNNKLTAEQLFYYSTCNESSSWRTDKFGNILSKNYKNL